MSKSQLSMLQSHRHWTKYHSSRLLCLVSKTLSHLSIRSCKKRFSPPKASPRSLCLEQPPGLLGCLLRSSNNNWAWRCLNFTVACHSQSEREPRINSRQPRRESCSLQMVNYHHYLDQASANRNTYSRRSWDGLPKRISRGTGRPAD